MGNLQDILNFVGEHPFVTFFSFVVVGNTISQSIGYIAQYKSKIHRQVVHNKIEDTFIEHDGIKYFSKIDGVDVESYRRK